MKRVHTQGLNVGSPHTMSQWSESTHKFSVWGVHTHGVNEESRHTWSQYGEITQGLNEVNPHTRFQCGRSTHKVSMKGLVLIAWHKIKAIPAFCKLEIDPFSVSANDFAQIITPFYTEWTTQFLINNPFYRIHEIKNPFFHNSMDFPAPKMTFFMETNSMLYHCLGLKWQRQPQLRWKDNM